MMLNIGSLDRYISKEKIEEMKKEIVFQIMSDESFPKHHCFNKEIKSKDKLLPQKIHLSIYLDVTPSKRKKSRPIIENQIFKDLIGFTL